MAQNKKPKWIEIIAEVAQELGGIIALKDERLYEKIKQKANRENKPIPKNFRSTIRASIYIYSDSGMDEKRKAKIQYFEEKMTEVGKWQLLKSKRSMPSMKRDDKEIFDLIHKNNVRDTEAEAIFKIRIGQTKFRRELWKEWKGCSVTGYEDINLLRASHIKPWRDCKTSEERLDINNGLLLLPNLDLAFDHGFITFNEEGKIVISENLSEREKIGIQSDFKLKLKSKLNLKQKKYLKYHRENIFKK